MYSLPYKGRYTQMRHGEIRNIFAAIMKEVCFDVEIEPKLRPLERESFVHKTTSTEDEARVDNKANGLWDSRFCRTFFNVMFFNTLAKSCRSLRVSRIINVEKSTFNPHVSACTGGAGPSATKVITRLVSEVNGKGNESYSEAISYIRTKINFALLCSCVLCMPAMESSISAVVHEDGCYEPDKPSSATNPRINTFISLDVQ